MFDAATFYTAEDLAAAKVAQAGTLANWRSQGKGPPYKKLGGKVVYLGADLNRWINEQTVDPAAAA